MSTFDEKLKRLPPMKQAEPRQEAGLIYISPAAISRMNAEELAGAKAQLWKRHNEISVEMDEVEEMLGLVEEREGAAKAPREGATT